MINYTKCENLCQVYNGTLPNIGDTSLLASTLGRTNTPERSSFIAVEPPRVNRFDPIDSKWTIMGKKQFEKTINSYWVDGHYNFVISKWIGTVTCT